MWDAPFEPPQQSVMETMVRLVARGIGFLSVGRIQDAYFFGLKAGDGNNVVACFSVVGGDGDISQGRTACIASSVGCWMSSTRHGDFVGGNEAALLCGVRTRWT